jgi:Flp pilus assembly protein TadG
MKKFFQFRKNEDGAMAVEFALVSVMMLMTLFGVLEVGRIFWTLNSMQSVLELTARYYIVNTGATDSELQTYAQTAMGKMQLDSSKLTVTVVKSTASNVSFIELDGTYQYQVMGAFMNAFTGLNLTSKTRMSYKT